MKLLELTKAAELETWLSAWDDLWSKAQGSPFQHPGWVVPWCRRLLQGPMCWMAAGNDHELACMLPVFPWTTDLGRTLSLMGQGISDYLGELVDPEQSEAFSLLEDRLADQSGKCSAWDFQQLRHESRLATMSAPSGWSSELTSHQPCPVVEIPPGASAVEDVVPPGMATRIRRQRRRARLRGELRTVVYEGARALEGMRVLWDLHQARWRARGQTGVLDAELEPFHRESVGWLGRRGVARVHVVELSGLPIGALHSLSAHGVTACYLQGISPSHQELSPGTLAIAAVIDWAARAGMRRIDMLRGQEPYKYDWGARDQGTLRRIVRRPEHGGDATRP